MQHTLSTDGSCAFIADGHRVVAKLRRALISQLTVLWNTPAESDANVIAVTLCEPTAGV